MGVKEKYYRVTNKNGLNIVTTAEGVKNLQKTYKMLIEEASRPEIVEIDSTLKDRLVLIVKEEE